ncbi:MAG: UDP-N-acetylglucosamine--N-acetylmuramyl-(pentapeptide) pyrophosphoryl-undecaprenol N-acetylglucosamine transferase [Planctomycetes bacterium]|nr:UDP-N-acetylglucosamine--N-acetylmuramyl-(pentapeptide) pyrophosphoryl-undecaprenol N-acetylglucosamine transferase [Planctomycetota bacterium]MCB9910175.1 UDP-N-acetylglucosamine--N-acetylmuramyl-(pentapeptide) pyrophosphoryl-undecaprenol N-acetylglucosamine transferase [Planctomycetota bacterium]
MKGMEGSLGLAPAAGDRSSLRLALAGGGTGGHLVPGLHLLRWALGQGWAPSEVLWFTSGRPVETRVLGSIHEHLPGVDVRLVPLPLEGAQGGAPSTLGLLSRSPQAMLLARRALREFGSDVLLGLGGFTALPCVLAAKSLGVPVALYEVNAVPGRATRRLAPLASRVLHAWDGSVPKAGGSKHRVIRPVVGPEFVRADDPEQRARARRALGWDPERPLLTVLGGSQGAGALNRFVAQHAARWTAAGWQVLHQTGPGRLPEAAPGQAGYHATEYLDPMAPVLAASELVLGRGGASTLAELAAVGVPAWIVPYPHHNDRHQWHNAELLGAGVRLVDEEGLTLDRAEELAAWAGPQGEARLAAMRAAFEASPGGGAPALWNALVELAPRLAAGALVG